MFSCPGVLGRIYFASSRLACSLFFSSSDCIVYASGWISWSLSVSVSLLGSGWTAGTLAMGAWRLCVSSFCASCVAYAGLTGLLGSSSLLLASSECSISFASFGSEAASFSSSLLAR